MAVKRVLLFLTGVTLIACNLVNDFVQLADHQLPSTNATTYRNERYNYELDYPANWIVDDAVSMTMFTSFVPNTLPYQEGIPSNETKIDFLHPTMMQPAAFEDYISQSISAENCILNEPVRFMLDEVGQAVEIIADSPMGGRHSIIYVELETRYYTFVTFGDLTPVRDIARSLRHIVPLAHSRYRYDFDMAAVVLPENECGQPLP
jgi:hypothetical protein